MVPGESGEAAKASGLLRGSQSLAAIRASVPEIDALYKFHQDAYWESLEGFCCAVRRGATAIRSLRPSMSRRKISLGLSRKLLNRWKGSCGVPDPSRWSRPPARRKTASTESKPIKPVDSGTQRTLLGPLELLGGRNREPNRRVLPSSAQHTRPSQSSKPF